MSTGLIASKIARVEKANRAVADESYVGGMLHDVGKMMLAASLPQQYKQALDHARAEDRALVDAEREVFSTAERSGSAARRNSAG